MQLLSCIYKCRKINRCIVIPHKLLSCCVLYRRVWRSTATRNKAMNHRSLHKRSIVQSTIKSLHSECKSPHVQDMAGLNAPRRSSTEDVGNLSDFLLQFHVILKGIGHPMLGIVLRELRVFTFTCIHVCRHHRNVRIRERSTATGAA